MAEAAVGFLLENLKQILLHHVHLIKDAKKEVERLENDPRLFSGFLKDSTKASNRSEAGERPATLQRVREIRNIVYHIEDVYVAESADKKSRGGVAQQVQDISAKVRHTLGSQRIELATLAGEAEAKSEPQDPQIRGPKVREDNIVGFDDVDDEANKLIGYLMEEEPKEVDAISIIGLPGLGKTTLASKIFRNKFLAKTTRQFHRYVKEKFVNAIPSPPHLHLSLDDQEHSSFSTAVLTSCCAIMLALLVIYFHIKTPTQPAPFPLLAYLVALATACTFVFIFVAKLIGLSTPLGKSLVLMGYFFAVLTFFLLISVFSPLWLSLLCWFIFGVGFITVVLKYSTSVPGGSDSSPA